MSVANRLLLAATLLVAACSQPEAGTAASTPATPPAKPMPAAATPATPTAMPDQPTQPAAGAPTAPATTATAIFGNGCFWCTEAVLEQLDGVLDVVSGYCGGQVDNPTYEQVCSGATGHAEVVQVTFDPARITYGTLCDWFFKSHDPTTLNRQGPDVGTQYRSAIFYFDAAQHQEALAAIERAQPKWEDPIVTEVTKAPKFWSAEAYHQDYFRNNPNKGYCRVMIAPKLEKLGLPTRAR
ncbi:MAG: hypothetical protein RL398_1584 [Planctomycetota bacterium]